MPGSEIVKLPDELRIERRLGNAARLRVLSWLPVVLLAPLAFMVEAVPAAIGILLIIGFTLREFRGSRGNLLPHLELADSGNLEEATYAIAEMAKRERDWQRKTFLVGVLSNLELRAGHRDTALALARETLRHSKRVQPVLQRSLRANLAMILTLSGHHKEALEELPETPAPDPVTDGSRLIVWARDGRWQDVANYKHRRMPQMEGLRHNNRVMALLKAAALERIGGGALKMQRYLDEARPRLANEYLYLSEGWPELSDFLDKHPELKEPRSILQRA